MQQNFQWSNDVLNFEYDEETSKLAQFSRVLLHAIHDASIVHWQVVGEYCDGRIVVVYKLHSSGDYVCLRQRLGCGGCGAASVETHMATCFSAEQELEMRSWVAHQFDGNVHLYKDHLVVKGFPYLDLPREQLNHQFTSIESALEFIYIQPDKNDDKNDDNDNDDENENKSGFVIPESAYEFAVFEWDGNWLIRRAADSAYVLDSNGMLSILEYPGLWAFIYGWHMVSYLPETEFPTQSYEEAMEEQRVRSEKYRQQGSGNVFANLVALGPADMYLMPSLISFMK